MRAEHKQSADTKQNACHAHPNHSIHSDSPVLNICGIAFAEVNRPSAPPALPARPALHTDLPPRASCRRARGLNPHGVLTVDCKGDARLRRGAPLISLYPGQH